MFGSNSIANQIVQYWLCKSWWRYFWFLLLQFMKMFWCFPLQQLLTIRNDIRLWSSWNDVDGICSETEWVTSAIDTIGGETIWCDAVASESCSISVTSADGMSALPSSSVSSVSSISPWINVGFTTDLHQEELLCCRNNSQLDDFPVHSRS